MSVAASGCLDAVQVVLTEVFSPEDAILLRTLIRFEINQTDYRLCAALLDAIHSDKIDEATEFLALYKASPGYAAHAGRSTQFTWNVPTKKSHHASPVKKSERTMRLRVHTGKKGGANFATAQVQQRVVLSIF
jgi:hypothetical protein